MSLADFSPLANHLWQSTLFVALVAVLALSLRRNQAQVRHWLWLAASVKFLVPFAALITIGHQFGWRSETVIQPEVAFVVGSFSQPFAQAAPAAVTSPATASPVAALPIVLVTIWLGGCAVHLAAWWVRWRRVAAVVRDASPLVDGRESETLRRLEGIIGTRQPIAAVTSPTSLEPGVFGIVNPVLIWPRSIGERLTDRQLEAILAHELCHVRRRDNLAATVHMVVESAFWFHPLVWWIEARLVDERERACDEEVIRLGSEPRVYAESILTTCQFYVESPLACVSGVTSSNLKKRVETIMRNQRRAELTVWRKLLLVTAGVMTIVAPVAVGVLNAPRLKAQSPPIAANRLAFEVTSIKPATPARGEALGTQIEFQPGGRFIARHASLFALLIYAYRGDQFTLRAEQVAGDPSWMISAFFDIDAKAAGDPSPVPIPMVPTGAALLRSLLEERFKLKVHMESRTSSVYVLLLARSDGALGPTLRPSLVDCQALLEAARGIPPQPLPPPPAGRPQCGSRFGPGTLVTGGATMSKLAAALSSGTAVGSTVLDRTGLSGSYDIELQWRPERAALAASAPDGPSIFTAVQEQLGLRLDRRQDSMDVLVIDHVERPSPN